MESGIPEEYVKRMLSKFGITDVSRELGAAKLELHKTLQLGPEDLRNAATEVHEYQAITRLDGILSLERPHHEGNRRWKPSR